MLNETVTLGHVLAMFIGWFVGRAIVYRIIK
jgi:hypothetical protein